MQKGKSLVCCFTLLRTSFHMIIPSFASYSLWNHHHYSSCTLAYHASDPSITCFIINITSSIYHSSSNKHGIDKEDQIGLIVQVANIYAYHTYTHELAKHEKHYHHTSKINSRASYITMNQATYITMGIYE